MTGLQWIASEAWTTAIVLQTPSYMPFLAGTLGIAIRRGQIPGLRDFLLRIRPDNDRQSSQDNNLVRVSPYTPIQNRKLISCRNAFQCICDLFMMLMFAYESPLFMNSPLLGEAVLGACISVQVYNPWHGV